MERLDGVDGLLHQFDSFPGGSVYKSISSTFPGDLKTSTQYPRVHECLISWELPTFVILAPCFPLLLSAFLIVIESLIALTTSSHH